MKVKNYAKKVKRYLFYYPCGYFYPKFLSGYIYKYIFKKKLDWKNPKTLNEKINWLKYNSDTSKWGVLSDKYLVRNYVKELGLNDILVKNYGVWSNANDIDFNQLPSSFVLKTNHGSGSVFVVKDKSTINIPFIRKSLNDWLKIPYGITQAEPHYRLIKPLIIAEELLTEIDSDSSSLIDYKIWCFDGKPYSLWVCKNRTEKSVDVISMDLNWKPIDYAHEPNPHYNLIVDIPQKPKNFSCMLEIAEKLSKGFPEVRVDLYNINGKIYFGEMTFTSMGGYMTYYSERFQEELGTKVKLPK